MKPQFLISAVTSGSGKTFLTQVLAKVLVRRGMKVQLFKSGPDVADTQFHTITNDSESYNLDPWLSSHNHLKYVYNTCAEMADVCIVEGNGGLFDGYKRMSGSGADVSQLLGIPVILVVNAHQSSYSLAPTLYGFRSFRRNVRVAGVIFNNVTSASQYLFLRDVAKDAGLECFGYMPVDESILSVQRNAVVTQSLRQQVVDSVERATASAEKYINIDKILSISTSVFPCEYSLPFTSEIESDSFPGVYRSRMKIAIARDPAFCLPYRENIDRLAALGEIVYFSPVNSRSLPESDLLYLPDGYVEQFARQLHRRYQMLDEIRQFAGRGGKIIAEGGSLCLLSHSVSLRKGGTSYQMADVFPFQISVDTARLQSGLRKVEVGTLQLHGYECRYAEITNPDSVQPYAAIQNFRGYPANSSVYRYRNVIASFTRWYWGEKDIMSLF